MQAMASGSGCRTTISSIRARCRPSAPTLVTLKSRLDALDGQIAGLRGQLTSAAGEQGTVAASIAEFEIARDQADLCGKALHPRAGSPRARPPARRAPERLHLRLRPGADAGGGAVPGTGKPQRHHLREPARGLGDLGDDGGDGDGPQVLTAGPGKGHKLRCSLLFDPARPLSRRGSELLAAQGQVLYALMLRDVRTRFFGSALGFLVTIAWPLVHIVALLMINAWAARVPPYGESAALFIATGVVPFMAFSYVSRFTLMGMLLNKPLLTLPIINVTDILFARVILEILSSVIVVIILGISFWRFWNQLYPGSCN